MWNYAPFICNHSPMGLGIAGAQRGLSAKFWPQHHSMPKLAEVISHLIAGIWAGLWPGIRLSPQYRAYTRALQREKSISPLFPGPVFSGPVGVVTNDWFQIHDMVMIILFATDKSYADLQNSLDLFLLILVQIDRHMVGEACLPSSA